MLSKNLEDIQTNQIKFPLEKRNSTQDFTGKAMTESEDVMKTLLNETKRKKY